MMCGPRNEAETMKRGTESDMTEGTEELLAKNVHEKELQENRGPRKKPPPAYIQLSPALQSELRNLQHAAARDSSASAAE